MATRSRQRSANRVPWRASIASAEETTRSRVYSETATGTSLPRNAVSTWAAAPNCCFSTQVRTTFVTSEPTASAIVVTSTGRPVSRATRTASLTASVCGLR